MALPKGQRRHFMCTLWPLYKDPTAERMEDFERYVRAWPDIQFCSYQYERTDEGRLHVQLYVEMKKSIRASTLLKILGNHKEFSKGCEIQFRKHSRGACKKYTTKDDSRVENTEPVIVGVWRPEKASKATPKIETCADLIREGYTADWIAYHRPELYLRYGTKIEATIHRRQLYHEREQRKREEEE